LSYLHILNTNIPQDLPT